MVDSSSVDLPRVLRVERPVAETDFLFEVLVGLTSSLVLGSSGMGSSTGSCSSMASNWVSIDFDLVDLLLDDGVLVDFDCFPRAKNHKIKIARNWHEYHINYLSGLVLEFPQQVPLAPVHGFPQSKRTLKMHIFVDFQRESKD